MTNKQMYKAYIDSRNPVMRDYYADTLRKRGAMGSSEARELASHTHLNKKKKAK
ncbi:hypothetical protein [Psychrobacter vallis]|uniref:hypothetical protein n=1 Tax=Psychrobacter vallis TaxID=248451 RepID=UPI001919C7FB|nr:hypothetical protein [Psychrobacter vallis]